jgi:hypothetical protein
MRTYMLIYILTYNALQPNRYFTLASADLVVPNQDAWHLFWDFTTLREIVDSLPGNSTLQNLALTTANEIMNEFNVNDPVSIRWFLVIICLFNVGTGIEHRDEVS